MTNLFLSNQDAGLDGGLLAPAPIGGKRRPVKLVFSRREPGVLYFARLSARRTQSRMSSIVGTPEYALMTIRNWSTTTKLLALLDDA